MFSEDEGAEAFATKVGPDAVFAGEGVSLQLLSRYDIGHTPLSAVTVELSLLTGL